MKNSHKRTLLLLVAVLLAFVTAFACACKDKTEPDPVEPVKPETITYTVNVLRIGSDPLAKVNVVAYDEEDNIKAFGTSDKTGKFTFTAKPGKYTVALSELPEGFINDGPYSVDDSNPELSIKLGTQLIAEPMPATGSYTLGSVMHDFSFTDTLGNEGSLSELLKEKKAVFINFWFIGCTWCVREFPDMVKAYKKFSDDVAVLGLNFVDDTKSVEKFRTNESEKYDWDELPFIMVGRENACCGDLSRNFGVTGCPFSLLIDRYGVVCFLVGGVGDESEFTELFDRATREPYIQKIYNEGELGEVETPDVAAPESAEIEKVLNPEGVSWSYYFDKDIYNWPWIVGENGDCIQPSNTSHNNSYAIMYTDITMTNEQCLAFDFKISSQAEYDFFYVFIDNILMHVFSGESPDWYTCYAYVPEKPTGTYNIAWAYVKDATGSHGEDTVYVKNLRFVDPSEIDHRTELLYPCATKNKQNEDVYEYSTVVYNESDGYYHVGTTDGPLVLADLMNATGWSNSSFWSYVPDSGFDEDLIDKMTKYCSYANNSSRSGLMALNKELKGYLDLIINKYDKNATENTWLKLCSYYKVFGKNEQQLADPAIGLAPHNAYETKLTTDPKNPQYNHVVKERLIMPRGIWYGFTPEVTGVYNVRSVGEVDTFAWIADENGDRFMENEDDPNGTGEDGNFSLTLVLTAGKRYYFLMDFNSPDVNGEFDFLVTLLADSGKVWMPASAGSYTADVDDDNNLLSNYRVDGAVPCALDEDNNYRVLNEDGSLGGYIYINLCNPSDMFQDGITIKDMLDISCHYCLKCGTKYHCSVADFEREKSHLCWICGETNEYNFEILPTFKFPKPRRDENGNLIVITTLYEDGSSTHIPLYELKDCPSNYDEKNYLMFLEQYGFGLTDDDDYTETMRHYIELAETEYPDEEEILDTGSHKGFTIATKELVEILSDMIVFGDYSFSTVNNAWMLFAAYYQEL